MAAAESGVLLVQALFAFTGKNNDELCFKKGDLIVVTQKEEGGWWEGTLSENTGWFPSNYVKEHKIAEPGALAPCAPAFESPPLSPQQTQQQVAYRTMVSTEIVESERAHVTEMKGLSAKYLNPLLVSDVLTDAEYKQLTGNLEEVIGAHSKLLALLEEQYELPSKEQRIGGTFLAIAPTLQAAHKAYISNHPKAVCIIEKHKDSLNTFMESHGSVRPGTLFLTTSLSQPFRRLDKYPGVLQEFQRHMEEFHSDRGDTQRSTHVFRELTTTCSCIRRQKQLELEVLTNKIHGWDGTTGTTETSGTSGGTSGTTGGTEPLLSVLGELVHMRSVALLPDNRDRYLVLFPGCLVVLALSARASSFIFEGKFPLSAICVAKLEDGSQCKNAFEISGNHMAPIVAICQTPADQEEWVEVLQQHIQLANRGNPNTHNKPAVYSSPPPVPPAHGSPLPLSHHNTSSAHSSPKINAKPWSLSCLRPSPPLRTVIREEAKRKNNRKKDDSWHEDDALILRVIEYYCTSAKARYTVNSSVVDAPASSSCPLLLASDEKMMVEEKRGDRIVHQEKSLIDTVYALKDQLSSMAKNYQELRSEFEMEKKLTHSLKNVIDQFLLIKTNADANS